MSYRVGIGVDAHAFSGAKKLVLGGVEFPDEPGLAGHSDGDVVTHALIDALLGASNLGDIGSLFPSEEDAWSGAVSLDLLTRAYADVQAAGWHLVNADCILIGEQPRIAARRDEMAGGARRGARGRGGPDRRARDHHRPAGLHGAGRRARRAGRRAPGARVKLVRYADRPDLLERRHAELSLATFPEYMHHNEPGARHWDDLYTAHPDFQLALLDGDEFVAELHSVPTAWDGSDEDLPAGWDEAFLRAFESGREPDVLCALAISVLPSRQGEGLAARMLDAMREAAGTAGLRELIAPVRPTLKTRYPLIPIERYATWRRDDGSHFDPWIRVHERVGGQILGCAPRSMHMEAPVSDWETWLEFSLPDDGDYVVEGMLAPLYVRDGVGTHHEPNVWLRHALLP